LSAESLQLIQAAFYRVDPLRTGVVSMLDMIKQYDAKYHPEVKSGAKTCMDETNDFMTAFGMSCTSANVNVSREDFVNYYASVWAVMGDNESSFSQLVRGVWHLSEESITEYVLATDNAEHPQASQNNSMKEIRNPEIIATPIASMTRLVVPTPGLDTVMAKVRSDLSRRSFQAIQALQHHMR
jgi:hypothetical protein